MPENKSVIPQNPKGNSDVITREYLDSLLIEERLIGSVMPSTKTRLFGKELETPIMTAALSSLQRFTEDGNTKLASAILRLGSIMWMGIHDDADVEATAKTGVPLIEIIKPYEDKEFILKKIESAKKFGCIAIGMDIDHCFNESGVFGADRDGRPMHPQTIDSIKEYVTACEGTPFILKGVLSTADASAALYAGVSALVLSHHHNIYPFAVPPLMVLPEIRKAVGKDMTLIVDTMIKDGYDAFKALALGADGVCVGRALQAPLVQSGGDGVYQYMNTMNLQLKNIMGRTGIPDLAHMTPQVLHQRVF